MPMLITARSGRPVAPLRRPSRKALVSAAIRSRVARISAVTSRPSTITCADAGARSSGCSTGLRSDRLIFSPAKSAAIQRDRSTCSAARRSASSVPASTRSFAMSARQSLQSNVSVPARVASRANSSCSVVACRRRAAFARSAKAGESVRMTCGPCRRATGAPSGRERAQCEC